MQASKIVAINQYSKRSPYVKPMTSSQNLMPIKIVQKQKGDMQESQQRSNSTKNNSGHNYYEEYIKTYLANKFLSQKMKEILEERNTLIEKINQLESAKPSKTKEIKLEATSSTKKDNILEDSKSDTQTNEYIENPPRSHNASVQNHQNQMLMESNAKKRHRKKNHELTKEFICHINNCGKNYCSEASLAQHIKNKHPESYDQWRVEFKSEKHAKEDTDTKSMTEPKLNTMCKLISY